MSTSTYNPYTPTTTAAYVAQYAHISSAPLQTQSTPLPYFPALTQHYASLSQQHAAPTDQLPHQTAEQQQPETINITPFIASRALRSLLAHELRRAGFSSAQRSALTSLEYEVVAFLSRFFETAHNYANLANRSGPIATDLLQACQDLHIPLTDLQKLGRASSKKKQTESATKAFAPALLSASPRSSSPELLPSDDDEAGPTIPSTLRGLPNFFPELPPKHTYLRTPASPPKRAALPSLEKKLRTAALVQESLKNLLIATEENINQEDAELLGHVVNWEMGVHPRKRWKVMKARRT